MGAIFSQLDPSSLLHSPNSTLPYQYIHPSYHLNNFLSSVAAAIIATAAVDTRVGHFGIMRIKPT